MTANAIPVADRERFQTSDSPQLAVRTTGNLRNLRSNREPRSDSDSTSGPRGVPIISGLAYTLVSTAYHLVSTAYHLVSTTYHEGSLFRPRESSTGPAPTDGNPVGLLYLPVAPRCL